MQLAAARRWRLGPLSTSNLVIEAFLFASLSIVLAVVLAQGHLIKDEKMRIEFVHSLLQVPLVVILGTGASLISSLYQGRKRGARSRGGVLAGRSQAAS